MNTTGPLVYQTKTSGGLVLQYHVDQMRGHMPGASEPSASDAPVAGMMASTPVQGLVDIEPEWQNELEPTKTSEGMPEATLPPLQNHVHPWYDRTRSRYL